MSEGLTRDEAVQMVKAVLEAYNIKNSPGLNEKDLGGIDILGQPVYFEYLQDEKVLRVHALCYRFRRPPRPGLMEGFHQAEETGTNTGGGSVEYHPENGGLFLSRTYTQRVERKQFIKDVKRLAEAGKYWAEEVLPSVSEKVPKRSE